MGRLTIGAVAAALVLVASPASAVETTAAWRLDPICTGHPFSTDGETMSVYVTVAAVPPPSPAIDHWVVCNVYVGGTLVGMVAGSGGVVVAGTRFFSNLPIGAVTYCVEWDTKYC